MSTQPGTLPGPSSKDNNGTSDYSPVGLLAYGTGCSVAIVEVRSMLMVHTLGGDRPDVPVTSVRWSPEGMARDLSRTIHPMLAVGDRAGRIAIWDAARAEICLWMVLEKGAAVASGVTSSGLAVRDMCWVYGRPWHLAAVHSPALIVVWDAQSGKALWRHEASEPITCIRSDPFDPRGICALGGKGLLIKLLMTGTRDLDVEKTFYHIPVPDTEAAKKEEKKDEKKDTLNLRFCFSPRVQRLLYVLLPREIVAFDLQFGMVLSTTTLPRSYSKLVDIVGVIEGELLYALHADGKISGWLRKDRKQAFSLKHIETFLPSLGTPPQLLAALHCPTVEECPGLAPGLVSSSDEAKEPVTSTVVSLSDDGRVWKWDVTAELTLPKASSLGVVANGCSEKLESLSQGEGSRVEGLPGGNTEPFFRAVLAGMLHSLPSAITTLAVPTPSTFSTGSPAVPLVALATASGSVEIVDPSALSVVTSFSVHTGMVRGVRWLGNTRVVSFSYTEVKGKGGGFANKLCVTCVRSGATKVFRNQQKPERAPMRGLRTSPSGRYLLVLFREAPAEVWAMTKTPQMLRSLALPFTVMEWALPAPALGGSAPPGGAERTSIAATVAAASSALPQTSPQQVEVGESFAFALVNGSLGVFELRGRRVRDFRPKWPASTFVSGDVLVTAMAYRGPLVVMGDRMGNLRWWNVQNGDSGAFGTHRGGVRRIRFAPLTGGGVVRGRIAMLFNDHTFGVYDLDQGEGLMDAVVQSSQAGFQVVELEWLPLKGEHPSEPLLLSVAVSDGSFRLLEVWQGNKAPTPRSPPLGKRAPPPALWNRYRPSQLSTPPLLPPPQALALRMLLQHGVQPKWFQQDGASYNGSFNFLESPTSTGTPLGTQGGDLRHFLSEDSHLIGEHGVLEVLLKALEPACRAGCLLDPLTLAAYTPTYPQGTAARCHFAASRFGEPGEAAFWAQLPSALASLEARPSDPKPRALDLKPSSSEGTLLGLPDRKPPAVPEAGGGEGGGQEGGRFVRGIEILRCEKEAVKAAAKERIVWHEGLEGREALQKRVHELIAVGDYEAAVTLLLSTPPDAPTFHVDALRAVALASAVSPALRELAVKVVAANVAVVDDSITGTHLLCAVGRHLEACTQLQDAGKWSDASTLAVTQLQGADLARVVERWAQHVLYNEQNLWRALILFVAAGALTEALAALHSARLPDCAAMFVLVCHEVHTRNALTRPHSEHPSIPPEGDIDASSTTELQVDKAELALQWPSSMQAGDVQGVIEYYKQYQRWLVHVCGSTTSAAD